MILVVYVDDLIIVANDGGMRNEVMESIREEFKVTQPDEPTTFVGLQIKRDAAGIHISQSAYVFDLLERYKMSDCAPQVTPYVNRLLKRQPDEPSVDATRMRELIGSLLYIANGTRPDIAAVVSALACHQDNATEEHWKAAKRVLRYLRGTANHGIYYDRNGGNVLHGFADADYAGDMDSRRSTSGIVFMLNGGPIQWMSKKQATVALSTTESEYVSASAAAQEAVHLRMLLKDLGYPQTSPTTICEDNQAVINVSRNQVYHGRLKHIDVRHHYIRDLVSAGEIQLEYCNSQDMVADILTKPLQRDQFLKLRDLLGLV